MQVVKVINCHAAGEVGDVVLQGLPIPRGDSLREISRQLSQSPLRGFLMNEPRGGLFRHKNILVPPQDPAADFAFLIFEPEDEPPMSGSNCICVATVILEMGLHPITEPITELKLESPAGLVEIIAECSQDRVNRVHFKNVPSFACKMDVPLQVEGLGKLQVDTAYGGDSFVFVDAKSLGLSLQTDEGQTIATLGAKIIAAANSQIGFNHPGLPWLQHISFCQMVLPTRQENGVKVGRQCVTIQPGKLDRSPTGTGCSARMALMHARGELGIGDAFVGESIIGSRFNCRIVEETLVGDQQAIVSQVGGSGFITGTQELWIRDDDPFPAGYRVSDTWPLKQ
ncbi:MAG: proline racemase family protein [Planctomycetota bacterium]|nr:proline racemase family protein [Planctomycetota bacterium]